MFIDFSEVDRIHIVSLLVIAIHYLWNYIILKFFNLLCAICFMIFFIYLSIFRGYPELTTGNIFFNKLYNFLFIIVFCLVNFCIYLSFFPCGQNSYSLSTFIFFLKQFLSFSIYYYFLVSWISRSIYRFFVSLLYNYIIIVNHLMSPRHVEIVYKLSDLCNAQSRICICVCIPTLCCPAIRKWILCLFG